MTKEEIISTVQGFLVTEFEVDPAIITPEANLRTTLDLDSLDYVDLVVVIESNLGFKVVGEDFINISMNVEDVLKVDNIFIKNNFAKDFYKKFRDSQLKK